MAASASRLFVSLVVAALALLPGLGRAADVAAWEFWVEQDGQVQHDPAVVHLKPAPFRIRFHGAASNTYGVAATAAPKELPNAGGNLGTVFRAGNGLLIDQPNTKISISAPGIVAKGWSSWNMWAWHDPTEKGFISGFQQRSLDPDGTATVTRTIDTLCVDDGAKDRCTASAAPPYASFDMLLATIPDLAPGQKITDTRWLAPKRVTVVFDAPN